MLRPDQIFTVVDLELNGPIAGKHSILSLGAVASTIEVETSSFTRRYSHCQN